ncbi:ATP-binding cassette domain-containing protein [Alkalicoccus urumqiensis]|nr:ATP-binding cassette domain-containing protein [Alkalicoccus urumqiensis]
MTLAVEWKAVTKKMKQDNEWRTLFKEADWKVEEKHVHHLSGGNAVQRSEALRMTGALIPCSRGEILIWQQDPDLISNRKNFRSKTIGYVNQEGSLVPEWSIYQAAAGADPDANKIEEVNTLLDHFRFTLSERQTAMEDLSPAAEWKASLVITLLNDPPLILLDDAGFPFPDEEKKEVYDILCEYIRRKEKTLIAASDDTYWEMKADKLWMIDEQSIISNQ